MITGGVANLLHSEVSTSRGLTPVVKAYLEYNNNRFSVPQLKVNTPLNVDRSLNHEDVVGLNRPLEEIRYAIVGTAKCSSSSSNSARYRVSGPRVGYSYMRSVEDGEDNNGKFDVQVNYVASPVNVLYAKFNTHQNQSKPQQVQVEVSRSPGTWEVAGTFTPDSSGTIELYRNGSGNWTIFKNYDNALNVHYGIRIKVVQGPPTGRVELVELASKYVEDVSKRVVSFSTSTSREEISLTNPLGVAEAGSATLTLDDTDGRFTNKFKKYRRYAERDAKLLLELGYELPFYGKLHLPQNEYWSDSWKPDANAATLTLECTDRSRWIQRESVIDSIFENAPVQYIARELLERSGISGLDFNTADGKERLPWVWYENGESLWDSLTTLAKAVSATFHYNIDGELAWFSKSEVQTSPVFEYSSAKIGSQQPNLMTSPSLNFEEVINRVQVEYEELGPNVDPLGNEIRQTVWSAQGDLLLRSSPLLKEIKPKTHFIRGDGSTNNPASVFIDPEDMKTWPFEGKFQIEGEVFSYKGKYMDNDEIAYEQDDIGDNELTGKFANVDRGIDGTEPDSHLFGSTVGGNGSKWSVGATWDDAAWPSNIDVNDGRLRMKSRADSYNQWLGLLRGVDIDDYRHYGTEITFPVSSKGRRENIAGINLHMQSSRGKNGYYFELATTDYIVNRRNSSVGNLRCYKNTGNSLQGLPSVAEDDTGEGLRGYFFDVEYGRPVRLDVRIGNLANDDQVFYVYINGQFVTSFTDNSYQQGLWGTYVRGDTEAEFEYFYAIEYDADRRFITAEQDVSGYYAQQRLYDRIEGGYTFAGPELVQSGRAGAFRWFFEEYQPIVHERREFDVEHSVRPSFNHVLLNSNPKGAVVSNLRHTPFRTSFTIDNASRTNEYVNGTDPAGNNYVLQIYGQPMTRIESQNVVRKEDNSIREHGVSEITYQNPWIQTEEQANEQGDFIKERWAGALDSITIDVVYDPTIELGDLVTVSHLERNISRAQYYITGIDVNWDTGFTCSLTLRRRR